MTRFKQKLKYISVELLLYQVIYILFKYSLCLLLEKDIGKSRGKFARQQKFDSPSFEINDRISL